tara:strand:+ start:2399 stop:4393 length:1995 start_codon:yes stop_codon:yes gene_type:complete
MSKVIQVPNGDFSVYVQDGGTILLDTGPGNGDVRIAGNLVVEGSSISIESTDLAVKDNIILVNDGELGAGITLEQSGIRVDRGSLSDAQWVFDERINWTDPSTATVKSGVWVPQNVDTSFAPIAVNNIVTDANGLYINGVALNAGGSVDADSLTGFGPSSTIPPGVDKSSVVTRDASGDFDGNIITASQFIGVFVGDTDANRLDGLETSVGLPVIADKSSVVVRDASGDFAGNVITAVTFIGDLTGTADDADLLNGITNASANTVNTVVNRDASGNFAANVITATEVIGDLTGTADDADLLNGITNTSANTVSTVVSRDASGNFAANVITATEVIGDLTGTADDSNLLDGLDTATAATPSTVVTRDASANFAGNVITATSFVGPITGTVTGKSSDSFLLEGEAPATTSTANTVVTRDASANFAANVITATTFTGALTGNADSASDSALLSGLATTSSNVGSTIVNRNSNGDFSARIINATTFNGALTGTASTASNALLLDGLDTSSTNVGSTVVTRDGAGNFAAGVITATTFSGALSGNATTSTTSATASNSLLLNGATNSDAASNSTIVQRTSAGYIYANFLNTTAGAAAGALTSIFAESANDNFIRNATAAQVATYISGQAMDIAGNAATATVATSAVVAATLTIRNSAGTTLKTINGVTAG